MILCFRRHLQVKDHLALRLIPSPFFLFNAVGNTISVSYTEKNCLCTLCTLKSPLQGPWGVRSLLHIKWQRTKNAALHRGTVLLCPLGDFNKVTEWNEIWSDVCSSAFLLCPLTIYRGVSTHGPVWLNDIWSVPLSEKMWFIALAYIYIISLRKSLQLS